MDPSKKHSSLPLKPKLLALAVTTALGTTTITTPASAQVLDILYFSIDGWFTMMVPDGSLALENDDAVSAGMYGYRTPIHGTMLFDSATGAGTGTVMPFSFFGGGPLTSTNISLQEIGNGAGGPGPLILANMGLNWYGLNGIPVSLVMDGTGLINFMASDPSVGDSVGSPLAGSFTYTCGNQIVCSNAATEDFGFLLGRTTYTLPMGPSPLVTTTFNTTDIGTVMLGINPSGTLPLTDDGIGGSPMKTIPFLIFNANFDITGMRLIGPLPIPIPATIWLFGSGLLGLIGISRKKKET